MLKTPTYQRTKICLHADIKIHSKCKVLNGKESTNDIPNIIVEDGLKG